MGQGGYIFCEWDSVQKQWPKFQRAFADLENRVIEKCNADWEPKTFGYLTPNEKQYGRTSILPRLFLGWNSVVLPHWRQHITSTGHQTLLTGVRTGGTLPEDFKVAWIGLAFPNKQMQISEIRWQISDAKFGRVNIEELRGYNKPALIFEEGFILNEEEAFDLYGYVEQEDYQRIIPLGAAYYRILDKVLSAPGAVI